MARAPEHGIDAATLLRRAEMAMGAAKGSSSGIGEWEPGYERDGSRRLQLLAGLRQALANSELRVEFQPKLGLGTGDGHRLRGTGSLAQRRTRSGLAGGVRPARRGQRPHQRADHHVLRLRAGRAAAGTTPADVGVAVNISARSLDDPVLVGQVAAMLTASGSSPAG